MRLYIATATAASRAGREGIGALMVGDGNGAAVGVLEEAMSPARSGFDESIGFKGSGEFAPETPLGILKR